MRISVAYSGLSAALAPVEPSEICASVLNIGEFMNLKCIEQRLDNGTTMITLNIILPRIRISVH